jgi:hypothetical protein
MALRPDSPAHVTRLRLITTANRAVGTEAVRAVRVLPPGAVSPTPGRADAVPAPATSAPSEGPAEVRETSTDYRKVRIAFQAARPERRVDPALTVARERQTKALLRQCEKAFALSACRASGAHHSGASANLESQAKGQVRPLLGVLALVVRSGLRSRSFDGGGGRWVAGSRILRVRPHEGVTVRGRRAGGRPRLCVHAVDGLRGGGPVAVAAGPPLEADLKFPRDVGHSMLMPRGRVLVRGAAGSPAE